MASIVICFTCWFVVFVGSRCSFVVAVDTVCSAAVACATAALPLPLPLPGSVLMFAVALQLFVFVCLIATRSFELVSCALCHGPWIMCGWLDGWYDCLLFHCLSSIIIDFKISVLKCSTQTHFWFYDFARAVCVFTADKCVSIAGTTASCMIEAIADARAQNCIQFNPVWKILDQVASRLNLAGQL